MELDGARVLVAGASGVLGGAVARSLVVDGVRDGRRELRFDLKERAFAGRW